MINDPLSAQYSVAKDHSLKRQKGKYTNSSKTIVM